MICSSNFFIGSINPFKNGITLDMFCNYCLFSKIWMFSCHPMSVNLLSGLFLVTVQCSVVWSCYNLLTEFNYCWTFLTFWTFLFSSPKCILCFEVNMAYNGCRVFWNVAALRVGGSEGVILTVDLTDTSFMKANSVVQLNGHVYKHFLWVWTLRIWGVDFFFFFTWEEVDFVSLCLCAISWTRRFILKNAGCFTIRKLFCYVYSKIFLFAFLHWKRVNNHWFFPPLMKH